MPVYYAIVLRIVNIYLMKNIFEYLLYCIPVVFIALSRMYMLRHKKLQGTGKIPDIVNAQSRQNFFLALSIITALVIFVFV